MFLIDELNFSNETELNSISQFSVSSTEGKRFHDAKELFDSAYALSKHSKHQFRHLMLCLKVANNATNNYQSCQSLYDFIMLSLCKTSKEPKRVLNNKVDLKNKAQLSFCLAFSLWRLRHVWSRRHSKCTRDNVSYISRRFP